MKTEGYTTSFTVDETPKEVFDVINNVRAWRSGEIQGDTSKLGAEFTYRVEDVHRSTQKVTEFIPGKKSVGCSLEHVEGILEHLENHDVSYVGSRGDRRNGIKIVNDIGADMHNALNERQERESGFAGVLMAGGTMDRVTLVTPMLFETRISVYTDVTARHPVITLGRNQRPKSDERRKRR